MARWSLLKTSAAATGGALLIGLLGPLPASALAPEIPFTADALNRTRTGGTPYGASHWAERGSSDPARLSEDERRAIVLAYFGGHSYRETAALLGAPEGTIKSRIRRGLAGLRRALEAQGMTP